MPTSGCVSMLTNLNETNWSRGTLTNNMGHGARSLQAKWKHNIDPGEMEEEGVGALLAVRLHSARSLGPTQRRARLHEPRGSAVRTPPPPGGEYLTSGMRAQME